MRQRCCWAFLRARYSTGDLALWWEVARGSALRTPDILFLMCAARLTHAMSGLAGFQSGETVSIPGACVPRMFVGCSVRIRLISSWSMVPSRHSQWRSG